MKKIKSMLSTLIFAMISVMCIYLGCTVLLWTFVGITAALNLFLGVVVILMMFVPAKDMPKRELPEIVIWFSFLINACVSIYACISGYEIFGAINIVLCVISGLVNGAMVSLLNPKQQTT